MAAVPGEKSFSLTSTQLRNLDAHKYSASGRSILEWPLQYFWNWLVQYVPLTVAPNTLTITGLAINILSSVILFLYTPHAVESAPSWVYFQCAIGFFVYQALDAIDGKQARRTNSASPLGELFDHGCDAVSLSFVGLAVPCAMQLGTLSHYLYAFYIGTLVVFYCAHWRVYICGVLEFGRLDVTEAQLLMMGAFCISGIWGPEAWTTELIGSLHIDVRALLLLITVGAVVVSVGQSIQVVFEGGQGKNGATIADTSVLSPSIPILMVLGLTHYIYGTSPDRIMQTQPLVPGLLLGFVFAKLSINLVVAHMSKSALILFDGVLLAPFGVVLNIYIGTPLPEFYITTLAMVYACFTLVTTSALTCQQICEHMGIYCFKLGKRKAE